MSDSWPTHLDAGAVRFARPTANYDQVLAFYGEFLGLPELARWRDHAGYDGVVFGLPGKSVQMEITQSGKPPVIPEPHPENQLVLYLRGEQALERAVSRLRAAGENSVDPENPYWSERGAVVFRDPDGWMVVLTPWVFGENTETKKA